MSAPRCTFVRSDGSQCKGSPKSGATLCFQHNPANAERVREIRSAGGLASTRGNRKTKAVLPEGTPDARLESVRDFLKLIEETLNQIRRGDLDPSVSTAMSPYIGHGLNALKQLGADANPELEAAYRPFKGMSPEKLLEAAMKGSQRVPSQDEH